MNTERDNFYDWHKDKPDTTNFAAMNRSSRPVPVRADHGGGLPWGRIGMWLVGAAAALAALKYFVL